MTYPLRKFFTWSAIIISVALNGFYFYSGFLEGIGWANLLLLVYALILAVVATSIYFIFIWQN